VEVQLDDRTEYLDCDTLSRTLCTVRLMYHLVAGGIGLFLGYTQELRVEYMYVRSVHIGWSNN
jgi:hypothetical protein